MANPEGPSRSWILLPLDIWPSLKASFSRINRRRHLPGPQADGHSPSRDCRSPRDPLGCDPGKRRRLPARSLILVDQQRTDALRKVGTLRTPQGGDELHAKHIGKRHMARRRSSSKVNPAVLGEPAASVAPARSSQASPRLQTVIAATVCCNSPLAHSSLIRSRCCRTGPGARFACALARSNAPSSRSLSARGASTAARATPP